MCLCVYEDVAVSGLDPLSLTRPAFDLRCGAASLLERHARYFAAHDLGALVRPELEDLCRLTHPGLAVNDPCWLGAGDLVLANARWLPPPGPPPERDRAKVGLVGGQVAFVVLPGGLPDCCPAALRELLEGWARTLPGVAAGGSLIDAPWDLIRHNAGALEHDYLHWRAAGRPAADLPGVTVLGPPERLLADPSARVEAPALVDTRHGPVLLDRDVTVEAFSRLEGPCYVGAGSRVFGARVYGGSVGPHCRVGGELEESILHGYTNKRHDGFLGHSYLGAWVNLGAGTQTSDLRNDYETIRMGARAEARDTGLLKVGAFVGDHTRTGIGTLLNVGTVVGPFCQLLPWGSLLPRQVPAFTQFAHGQLRARTDLRQMLATADRVVARRGVAWTATDTDFFFSLYEGTSPHRRQALRDAEQRRLRRLV